MKPSHKGIAFLVGSGPGDLGLVTLRARQLIEQAEVIIYDYLCNPELLQWASPKAEILYVGKSGNQHTLTQDEINRLLIERVKSGLRVVRLKGGDPFVFGRGGEEAEELVAESLAFEIVPGISSAIAAPAYAGIPVTHRAFASSFTVLTGHEDPAKEERGTTAHDWPALAKFPGTKIILMGVERLQGITERLISHGATPELPIALVRWGTWGRQQTLVGTLGTIAQLAEAQNFQAPAVAILGEVVTLREKLNWFESRPLFGQRIVVTRTRAQASGLSERLRERGADVLEIPTIRINPLPWSPEQNRACADFSAQFDWLIFTSPNAVDLFFDGFFLIQADIRALGPVSIAAVGPATAARVRARSLTVARQPKEFTTEALAAAFTPEEIKDRRFCLPRGNLAEPTLPNYLKHHGGQVTEWTIYETVPETIENSRPHPHGASQRFQSEGADWITFTSASTAENWHRLNLSSKSGPAPKIASIGPVTSHALRALGYEVAIEAKEHTLDGLTEAILEAAIAAATS